MIPTPRFQTGVKILLAFLLLGAVARHAVAIVGWVPPVGSPARHLVWIAVNLGLFSGLVVEARWLPLALVPVTLQQMTSHGWSVVQWMAGGEPFDGISLLVMVGLAGGWWLVWIQQRRAR